TPIPSTPDRDARGLFQPGNRIAYRHGLRAQVDAALADERRAFLNASLADDGGPGEVPTRRRSLHEYRARLHVHIGQLSGAIERHGVFDGRGRLRTAWLQRLDGLIDRARALDATLGLDRRARPIVGASDLLLGRRPEDTP
ncbi:MAG: hypothetical protein IT177_09700, partial [Acidobacteria bacterium]|nr:hypothetical protein [Acidobacteriota bacterium]